MPEALDKMITQAEAQLIAQVNNMSLRQIKQSGASVNAIKYHEGRCAALKTTKLLGQNATHVGQLIQQLTGKLQMAKIFLNRFTGSDPASLNWINYYHGEINGYHDAMELLSRNSGEEREST